MYAVFCHSAFWPKLATLESLRRQKKLPPTAVDQKHPGFGRFDFFLSRSVGLKAGNLMA
jgi:hypothetical protein